MDIDVYTIGLRPIRRSDDRFCLTCSDIIWLDDDDDLDGEMWHHRSGACRYTFNGVQRVVPDRATDDGCMGGEPDYENWSYRDKGFTFWWDGGRYIDVKGQPGHKVRIDALGVTRNRNAFIQACGSFTRGAARKM